MAQSGFPFTVLDRNGIRMLRFLWRERDQRTQRKALGARTVNNNTYRATYGVEFGDGTRAALGRKKVKDLTKRQEYLKEER